MALAPITFPLRLGVRVARSAAAVALTVPQRAFGLVGGLLAGRGPSTPEPGRFPSARPRPPAAARPPRSTAPPEGERGPTRTDPRSAGAAVEVPPGPPSPSPGAITPRPSPSAAPASSSQSGVGGAVPTHVSTETTLVESFAEAGAQDGAGAQITVDPPWPGYERLTAADVINHLSTAESGQLSLVALYEGTHRNRRTVLAAAERELRARS